MDDPIETVKKTLLRKSSDVDLFSYGKVPPQVKDLEEVVLGAVMIDRSVLNNIADILKDESFYVDQHQRIWKAIRMLNRDQSPIDLLTVTEQLKRNGDLEAAGGPFYVATLTNKCGSGAHAEYHARIIAEKYMQRQLISTSTEIIKDAYEDQTDVFELLDRAEKNLQGVRVQSGGTSTTEMHLQEADRQSSSGFVKSKHRFINAAFGGGWQKGALNIVAARPAMGKSAWHVSELIHCVNENYKCASFNLEMLQRQLMGRIICNLTAMPNTRYVRKDYHLGEEERVSDARSWIKEHDYNLSLDFTAGITIWDIISKLRKIKSDKGLDVVFIDHLQFITLPSAETKGKTKDQQIGEITRALKGFAKDNDVAMIVLCHLSRETERGASKRPGLSHLRESGNIENDSDTVSFLFRAEYYFEKDENGFPQYKDQEQEKYKNICQWFNDKNRDGPTFESEMKCFLGTSNFIDVPKDEVGSMEEKKATVTGNLIPISKAQEETDDSLPF